MWRGGLGAAYLLPALSSAGASLAGGPAGGRGKTGKERQSHNLLLLLNVMASSLEASPCFRFHIPLFEPDMRISRFRLSEKGSRCRPRDIARPLAKADEAPPYMDASGNRLVPDTTLCLAHNH
jgi:hypothetical protein